jgi:hypothetical protein
VTEGLTEEQKKRLAELGGAERSTLIIQMMELAAEMWRYRDALQTIARMDRAPVAQAHARAALNPEETL